MKKQLIRQFGHPRGPLGLVAGRVMATRASNVERNKWTAALLASAPDSRILELGHGPGIALASLWPALDTGTIVGVDVSELMHRTAARRNREGISTGRVELVTADAQALPERLTGFDIIFGVNVTMFWVDVAATIDHLVGRLTPGGELVLIHMPPPTADPSSREVADELAHHFRAAGLVGVDQQTMEFEPPAIATRGRRESALAASSGPAGQASAPTTSSDVSPSR